MPKLQEEIDNFHLDIAERVAKMSSARRTKVGTVIAKGRNIIAYGWNGMPTGYDNNCEIENPDGTLTTRPEVIHAERNAVEKLIEENRDGHLDGSTFYATHSPCPGCAQMIIDAKVKRVVYRNRYRLDAGIIACLKAGIVVDEYSGETRVVTGYSS